MSTEELLKAGIAAAQAGDLQGAAAFFSDVVRADPSSQQGWLMLGMCIAIPERRAYCLQRVLALNPNHAEARRQLDRLSLQAAQATPAPAKSTPPFVAPEVTRPDEGDLPLPTAVREVRMPPGWPRTVEVADRAPEPEPFDGSPYYLDEQPEVEAVIQEPAPAEEAQPQKHRPGAKPSARKKSNKALVIALAVGLPVLALCGIGVVYFALSGGANGMILPPYVEIPTALLMPTANFSQPTQAADMAGTPTPMNPTALPSPLPTVSYQPKFEAADCKFEVPHGAHVSCGYLIVPEDRAGDPSRTIRLAVAVYHSTNPDPEPNPVLFLQGGPGAGAVELSASAYRVLVAPLLRRRDFITYDQRGTGLSQPALGCDELTKAFLQDTHGQIPASARKLVYKNAFLSCQGLMSTKGIDLNAYTTVASAADVKDLLAVLKYKQADLYGASYGTRLAEVVMRDDPQIVHSAILDSVVPIETNVFSEYPGAIEGALQRMFQACGADAECNAAYPNLEQVFWEQVQRLDAEPISLTIADPKTGAITETVDGSVLLNIVAGSLKQSALIYTVPQTIYRFKAGDYSTVLAAESSLPFVFDDISAGLFISMMCHENILATSPEQLGAATGTALDIRNYAWLPFYGNAEDVYRACQTWKAVGPRLGENDPLSSDIPTLVITGAYDPTTPPKYAQQVKTRLSRSYYFEFPNQGHAPTAADTSGCAMELATQFLANPLAEPDRSCLDEIRPVKFLLPYTGDPPVELSDGSPWGISARVPADWTNLGDGYYLRGNSPFDITQIGLFPVPGVRSADLLKWISMKAYGYRGLDSAPVQSGQQRSNGLDWSLYTSTSYGRPVDIAMTDYKGSSLVILAFSNIDEHEALYRTVFLPMVKSVEP